MRKILVWDIVDTLPIFQTLFSQAQFRIL